MSENDFLVCAGDLIRPWVHLYEGSQSRWKLINGAEIMEKALQNSLQLYWLICLDKGNEYI